MQGEFKQCLNGHYYQGASCPYCKTGSQASNSTSLKTEIFITENDTPTKTSTSCEGYTDGRTQTTISDAQSTMVGTPRPPQMPQNRTVFGEEESGNYSPTGHGFSVKSPQYGRKLVGWLVTYSYDELGIDFKLFEGRNIIGRDIDCNITVNDGRMSGKHAVLLFRANKYSLTDSQSSHGTFVNDVDIELEPRYLKDGDIIRMGNTVFKFRTSL